MSKCLKSTLFVLSLSPSSHLEIQIQMVSNDDVESVRGATSFQWLVSEEYLKPQSISAFG